MLRIGVDVGGTNTDAVLMDGRELIAFQKSPTTANVSDGIIGAIRAILAAPNRPAGKPISAVMIGTTHFTNAFVERRELLEVGVLRIALPATRGVPPLSDWPPDLLNAIGRHVYCVRGGYQFDGRTNSPLDELAIAAAARDMKAKGLKAAAICGLFSPVNAFMEERALEIFAHQELITLLVLVARLARSFQIELGERAVGGIERTLDLAVDLPEALIQPDSLDWLLKGRKCWRIGSRPQAHQLRREG